MLCFSVLKELRPHVTEEDFLAKVKRQQKQGYQLVYLKDANVIESVAGFRIYETMFSEKMLYVDDLVTSPHKRSQGYGQLMFDWLINHAKENHCQQLHLDSGEQRFDAHRFCLKNRMRISSHHFIVEL